MAVNEGPQEQESEQQPVESPAESESNEEQPEQGVVSPEPVAILIEQQQQPGNN